MKFTVPRILLQKEKWEVVISDEWTKTKCERVCVYGQKEMREFVCAVGRSKCRRQSSPWPAKEANDLLTARGHTHTHTHTHLLQMRGKNIVCLLQDRHVRGREPQNPHITALSLARDAKHMTTATKGKDRKSKTTQSVRIWQTSAQTCEQHTALQGARSECVNMPRTSGSMRTQRPEEPSAGTTLCSVTK